MKVKSLFDLPELVVERILPNPNAMTIEQFRAYAIAHAGEDMTPEHECMYHRLVFVRQAYEAGGFNPNSPSNSDVWNALAVAAVIAIPFKPETN